MGDVRGTFFRSVAGVEMDRVCRLRACMCVAVAGPVPQARLSKEPLALVRGRSLAASRPHQGRPRLVHV